MSTFTRSAILTSILFLVTFFNVTFLTAQFPLNLDFEKSGVYKENPWGWRVCSYADAECRLDSATKRSGKYSFEITSRASPDDDPFDVCYLIPPHEIYGKKIRLKGFVQAGELKGEAFVALESYGAMGVMTTIDTARITISKIPASVAWQSFELEVKLSPEALSFYIHLGLKGSGTLWFDDISLMLDNAQATEITVAKPFSKSKFEMLDKQAFTLSSVDATSKGEVENSADLRAFEAIAGKARIIALGESTHGTSEFFRMKHRLLEYGVKHMGVRVFAIEANQLDVEIINTYVLHGIGEPKKLMSKTLFAVWNTEEVLDLINWMRDYNVSHPDKQVAFVGFDMQNPLLAMDSLLNFLADKDPVLGTEIGVLIEDFRKAWQRQNYPMASDSTMLSWKNSCDKMWARITQQETQWLRSSITLDQVKRTEWAIQNARVVHQNANSRYYGGNAYRDSSMAQNLRWQLERYVPGTRAIVWAHDVHIARCDAPSKLDNYNEGISMGSYLSMMYGSEYCAFGFSTYDGTYSAITSFSDFNIISHTHFPSPVGSMDEALHRVSIQKGSPTLILDLRGLRSENNQLFDQPVPVRFVSYFPDDYTYGQYVSLPYQFDGLIYVDHTSGSKILD